MATSRRFRALNSRIRELKQHFLPKIFSPTGTYTSLQHDRARAFRVLAHAEFEAYLEDIAVETANVAFDLWQSRGRIIAPLIALSVYAQMKPEPVPSSLLAASRECFRGRLKQIKEQFNKEAKGYNNGIREQNILRLLFPVGITEKDIDPAWLGTIDAFGRNRGETAHTSAGVINLPDPQDESEAVDEIVKGLSEIDLRLITLRGRPKT